MLKATLRIFVFFVFFLALSGCLKEPIYPTKATQEITILKNGQGHVRYVGTFRDVYPEWLQFEAFMKKQKEIEEKDGKYSSAKEFSERALQEIGSDPKSKVHIESVGQSTHKIEYEKDFLWKSGLPYLLESDSILSKCWLGFTAFSKSSRNTIFQSEPQKDFKEFYDLLIKQYRSPKENRKQDEPDLSAFFPILKNLKGELIIRTDGIVAHHNAQRVSKNKDGLSEYRWNINGENLYQVEFLLAFDQADLDRFYLDSAKTPKDCEKISSNDWRQVCRLKAAKPGSSCREIISDDCKCGPFVISDNVGNRQKNRGYKIVHAEGELEGCTDEQGNTESVTVKTTGACRLYPLTKDCTGKAE